MTFFIRKCIIFFLFFEMIVFLVIYCFGPKSLKTLYDVRSNIKVLALDVLQLEKDLDELGILIKQNSTSFAKERIAREKLLMKKKEEVIYFVKN